MSGMRALLERLAGAGLALWAILTLSFFLMRLAPGGPFDADRRLPPIVEQNLWRTYGMAEDFHADQGGVVAEILQAPGAVVSAGDPLLRLTDGGSVRAQRSGEILGWIVTPGVTVSSGAVVGVLKTSLLRQYFTAMGHYLLLDFGVSMSFPDRTVFELLAETAPVSAELGAMALLIALVLGVGSGLIAGLRPNTWVDHTMMIGAMLGVSISTIVLGPLLILAFSGPGGSIAVGGWDRLEVKILPALTLGLVYAAYFARLTRGGMLDVIGMDFIRTARAKGIGEGAIVFRHALRGAILPTVSFLGPATAALLCGSVVVERIFRIPGVSEFFVSGALNRDYPLVMGVVVLYSSLLVGLNLLVDLSYAWLDPRVRGGSR